MSNVHKAASRNIHIDLIVLLHKRVYSVPISLSHTTNKHFSPSIEAFRLNYVEPFISDRAWTIMRGSILVAS
jgi:hypothetical protein